MREKIASLRGRAETFYKEKIFPVVKTVDKVFGLSDWQVRGAAAEILSGTFLMAPLVSNVLMRAGNLLAGRSSEILRISDHDVYGLGLFALGYMLWSDAVHRVNHLDRLALEQTRQK